MGNMVLQCFLLTVKILILCPTPTLATHGDQKGAWEISNRIHKLMEGYWHEGSRKIEQIHHIRFSYEETPFYEMGYVMGEIIERYRKMVEHVKRPRTFVADGLLEVIKRAELIQMLYFEIYHLVNMLHEIPRKHGYSDDMASTTPMPSFDTRVAEEAQQHVDKVKKERDKAKKKKLKELKKIRDMVAKGQALLTTGKRKPQNKWWPIDYGWEIDYYW